MARLYVESRKGTKSVIEGKIGISLMELIRDCGIDELLALCGGSCYCATCHVYVDSEFVERLPTLSDDENELLESSSYRLATSRLSCQIVFSEAFDGLRIKIAPED
jgi:2Fe-2S ferredoxin